MERKNLKRRSRRREKEGKGRGLARTRELKRVWLLGEREQQTRHGDAIRIRMGDSYDEKIHKKSPVREGERERDGEKRRERERERERER